MLSKEPEEVTGAIVALLAASASVLAVLTAVISMCMCDTERAAGEVHPVGVRLWRKALVLARRHGQGQP